MIMINYVYQLINNDAVRSLILRGSYMLVVYELVYKIEGGRKMSKLNHEKIGEIVREIRAGNDLWDQLFVEIKMHRAQMTSKYYHRVAQYCAIEDVIGAYDDSVWRTVNTIESDTENYFIGMLSKVFINKVNAMHTFYSLPKRKFNAETIPLTCSTDGEFENPDAVICDDSCKQQEYFEMAQSIISALKQYCEKGEKEKANGILIQAEMQCIDLTQEERKEFLMSKVPQGTSWDSCRQKLSRAKKSFKEFYLSVTTANENGFVIV